MLSTGNVPFHFGYRKDVQPGELFSFRKDDRTDLAMAIRYRDRDHLLRFFPSTEKAPAAVVLSNAGMNDRSLLIWNSPTIALPDKFDFVGPPELDDQPVQSGWFGCGFGSERYLTCADQPVHSNRKIFVVDLSSGQMLDGLPIAVWYRRWAIHISTSAEPEVLFSTDTTTGK